MAVVDVKTDRVLLAVSCSDGAVRSVLYRPLSLITFSTLCPHCGLFHCLLSVSRLFSVSEVKCQIDLLWETFYHQRCVLSVATCSLEDGKGNR